MCSLRYFFFNFLLHLHFQSFSNELRVIFVDVLVLNVVVLPVPPAGGEGLVFIRFFFFQCNFVSGNTLEVLGGDVDDCIENLGSIWGG